MIYIPRGFQYVEAFRFDSWKINERDATRLGMKSIPQGTNGRCDCGRPLSDHALLNNQLVCPGLYIIYAGNKVSSVLRPEDFERAYRPMSDYVIAEVNDAKKES